MKQFIGTKVISAEPCAKDGKEGYTVVYKDGYTSWSPKEAFDEAYVALDDIPNGVTEEALREKFVSVSCIHIEGTTTTLCNIQMQNGFVVTGTSGCVDPAAFNAEIGAQVAYQDAFNEAWKLEGYLLRQRRLEAGLFQLTTTKE
jgi:hypothetical protein